VSCRLFHPTGVFPAISLRGSAFLNLKSSFFAALCRHSPYTDPEAFSANFFPYRDLDPDTSAGFHHGSGLLCFFVRSRFLLPPQEGKLVPSVSTPFQVFRADPALAFMEKVKERALCLLVIFSEIEMNRSLGSFESFAVTPDGRRNQYRTSERESDWFYPNEKLFIAFV